MKALKSISTKAVGLNREVVLDAIGENTEPVAILRVYGRILGAGEGTTQFGRYVKFSGMHEAVNLNNGEVYRSDILILPEPCQTMLESRLLDSGGKVSKLTREMNKPERQDIQCEYALDILAQAFTGASGPSFRWGMDWLMEIDRATDALARLGDQFGKPPLLTDKTEKKTSRPKK